MSGGTVVNVYGVNFTSSNDLKCIFGANGKHGESKATYVDSNRLVSSTCFE